MNAAIDIFKTERPDIDVQLHRVPFFLEPQYNELGPEFTESHDERMLRKFGSPEVFESVKRSQALIPRGLEVGMDASVGWTQENLSRRIQSSTLNAHRLVLFIEQAYGVVSSERIYSILNRLHFTEGGVLNDPSLLDRAIEETFEGDIDAINASKAHLLTEKGKSETLELASKVTDEGISGIPTLIVDGQFVVSPTGGTQDVLKALRAATPRNGKPSGKAAFALLNRNRISA